MDFEFLNKAIKLKAPSERSVLDTINHNVNIVAVERKTPTPEEGPTYGLDPVFIVVMKKATTDLGIEVVIGVKARDQSMCRVRYFTHEYGHSDLSCFIESHEIFKRLSRTNIELVRSLISGLERDGLVMSPGGDETRKKYEAGGAGGL